ncbi:MAG: hypothetical protein IK115_08965 [Lachnospiraceae bacterium]|nr:hypothetical protein [Lachnospiraceae bacterium]
MNNLLNKMEKKLGRYAIPRLPMVMLITYAIGYVMQTINPGIIDVISLNPYAILHGQLWRVISWILIPPEVTNLFFVLIMLYFYYSIGNTLERTWGTFYFNLYFFSGLLFTLIGAFCMYAYASLFQGDEIALAEQYYILQTGTECPALYGGNYYFCMVAELFSTYYINMSIFLAFAATYPDMQVLLMFFIPIKVKILGVIYGVILVVEAYDMCRSSGSPLGLFVIGASLLNFLVFFLITRKGLRLRSPQARARQRQFRQNVRQAQDVRRTIARHKCAICGRTSDEYPDLEFRFCSKCEGNYEYCQDHLFTHKHFTRSGS